MPSEVGHVVTGEDSEEEDEDEEEGYDGYEEDVSKQEVLSILPKQDDDAEKLQGNAKVAPIVPLLPNLGDFKLFLFWCLPG